MSLKEKRKNGMGVKNSATPTEWAKLPINTANYKNTVQMVLR
jgi:hypothetical protein